jgi:LacI family repressor for deo operon, udp, cdd, tsx, nupC, and nupG
MRMEFHNMRTRHAKTRLAGVTKPRMRRSKKSAGATIIDVAQAAKVSTATVSRVLSSPEKVVESTRAHVLRVIAQLSYSPNAAAKSLRTLETRKLLVILSDISNPFFALILQGIEEAAAREGYSVLVGDTREDRTGDTQYSTMLPRREVDGLVVLSHGIPKAIQSWMQAHAGIPPVVTTFMAGEERGELSVTVDNAAIGGEMFEHLYGYGHRRVGVIGGYLLAKQMQLRLQAVRAAARRAKVLQQLSVEGGHFSIESGVSCATKLLARPERPTALLCFSDRLALGAITAARQMGLSVPEDVSVIGCDDLPTSPYLWPPLTTVAIPMMEAGREAVRVLIARLRGTISRPTAIVMPHRLVIRGSTAVLRKPLMESLATSSGQGINPPPP